MKNLETILLETKKCTQDEIDQAYSIQKEYGGQIGNILLNLGAISDKTLIDAISIQYSMKLFSDANIEKVEKMSIDNISLSFLNENSIYPIYETEKYIAFATNSPLKVTILSIIKNLTAKDI